MFLNLKALTSDSWPVALLGVHLVPTWHMQPHNLPNRHQPDTCPGRLGLSCCVFSTSLSWMTLLRVFLKSTRSCPSFSRFSMLCLLYSGAPGIPDWCSKCNFCVLFVELLWFFGGKTVFLQLCLLFAGTVLEAERFIKDLCKAGAGLWSRRIKLCFRMLMQSWSSLRRA